MYNSCNINPLTYMHQQPPHKPSWSLENSPLCSCFLSSPRHPHPHRQLRTELPSDDCWGEEVRSEPSRPLLEPPLWLQMASDLAWTVFSLVVVQGRRGSALARRRFYWQVDKRYLLEEILAGNTLKDLSLSSCLVPKRYWNHVCLPLHLAWLTWNHIEPTNCHYVPTICLSISTEFLRKCYNLLATKGIPIQQRPTFTRRIITHKYQQTNVFPRS
jgi:hypothetical protein